MAKIHFPSEYLNGTPNLGESKMLDFLQQNLDDSYEIYFKPNFSIDTPDIILIKEGGGVLIINVYNVNAEHRADKKHPSERLKKYKENLINLHIPNLLQYTYKERTFKDFIGCLLFVYTDSEDKSKLSFNNYSHDVDVLTEVSLSKEKLDLILVNRNLSDVNTYFKEEFYNSFRNYLLPNFHYAKEGIDVNFTRKQKEFSISKIGEQKIRGVVGSGKTLVLAQRAVNAHKRTNDKVLILTYNHSLKNYIKGKLANVKEDFSWDNFIILNYHDFFTSVINNLSIKITIPKDFESWSFFNKAEFFEQTYYGNLNIFEGYEGKISKYSSILIDEVQDYKTNWLRLIKKCFLVENGEFVVFGDSKQDIYNRLNFINNKKELVIPESPGRWGELNESFRLTPTITAFASAFQQKFLSQNHNLDQFENTDFQSSLFDKVHYRQFQELNFEELANFIYSYSTITKSNPNDISVLSTSIEVIREIDFLYRKKSKQLTSIMSETKEVYDKLHSNSEYRNVKNEIEKIRKNKKIHFKVNSGLIKFSTIHSFKGWESKTLFLIVNLNNTMEGAYKELIYTGFTRCTDNLIILNIKDEKLHSFINELQYIEKI